MKYTVLTCLSIYLILCSCTNGLDLYPTDKISSNKFWKTADDALKGVNATYQYVFPESDEYGMDLFFYESASDNSYNQHSNQFGNFQQIALGAYESNHAAIKKMWDLRYECIRKCNEFMENIERVSMDKNLRERYIGEVCFQRAYAYYYLIALFGDVPLVDKTLTIQEAGKVSRTTRKTVADFIIKDLDFAIEVLPESYSGDDDGRATKWAALALKSRVCLLMAGDYRENPNSEYWGLAADAAYKVWKESKHQLYRKGTSGADSYAKLFYDNDASASNSEVIYETQFTTLERPLYGFTVKLACVSDGGWNSWTPTQDMVNAYYMKSTGKRIDEEGSGYDPERPYEDRDPRMKASIYYPGNTTLKGLIYNSQPGEGTPDRMDQHNGTKTGYGWKKFLDPALLGTWDTGKDFPLIRLAEVLLNYAEAKNEVLDTPDQSIYDAVNAIRLRVQMPKLESGLDKDKMRERIRDERRVELAFEGTRFFDIRRWHIAHEVLNLHNGWILGMKLNNPDNYIVDNEGYVRAGIRIFNSEKHYLWPIPQRETELNSNLLPNNPGWN